MWKKKGQWKLCSVHTSQKLFGGVTNASVYINHGLQCNWTLFGEVDGLNHNIS